jgi:copper chaperone CopZ
MHLTGAEDSMQKLTVAIEGMSCAHCVGAVRRALEGVDGVTVERVALGSATVDYDPTRASAEAIAVAIEDAGYQATVVGR